MVVIIVIAAEAINMCESWEDYVSPKDLNFKRPESWDAKDFIFSNKYFCPICATPESGRCNVLKE